MIHLVNMPFASQLHPSLPLGQIKAQLEEADIKSRVFNLNFDFANRFGMVKYETLVLMQSYFKHVGEWLFSREAWGNDSDSFIDRFLECCASDKKDFPEVSNLKDWLLDVRSELVPAFLDECCHQLFSGGNPKVVGFSCTFLQRVPSLALARRLKKMSPSVKIVFGGAMFHHEMGRELIKKVPFIDALSTGEADDIIVPLFHALLHEREPDSLQGIIYKNHDGRLTEGPAGAPVSAEQLEKLPDPDYDEYFEDLTRFKMFQNGMGKARFFLPFESSRGCWWGQKHHCTFCGLNHEGMAYRAKSSRRVIKTLRGYLKRYPLIKRFHASDCIIPNQYFKNFLPHFKENFTGSKIELFYEVKTNLTRSQVKLLADAGIVHFQPGIESLSTHLLKLMRKGGSALKNTYLLKLCRIFNIYPHWTMLYRIPGEKKEDYEKMVSLIPKTVHFFPPCGGPLKISLQRFSPYFTEKEKWTENIRPQFWYSGIFPDNIDLSRVAYYFDADWKDTLNNDSYREIVEATFAWIDVWRNVPVLPGLHYNVSDSNNLRISDTRFAGCSGVWNLNERETLLYKGIDDPITPEQLRKKLGSKAGSLESIKADLQKFVDYNIAIEESGIYLGLALPDNTPEPNFRFRSALFKGVNKNSLF